MTALVVAETFVLGLLTVLVVGLLRAYADVQERVEGIQVTGSVAQPGRAQVGAELSPHLPTPPDRATPVAADIAGLSLRGEPVHLSFSAGGVNTMLAFLESGCLACQAIFRELGSNGDAAVGANFQVVIVTRNTDEESPSRLSGLKPDDVPLVMATQAWEDYEVPGSPYFVYIDGASGTVHGEGAGEHWEQVKSLLRDAMYDAAVAAANARGAAPPRPADGAETADQRARRAEAALAAAGIPLDDPSLLGETATVTDV